MYFSYMENSILSRIERQITQLSRAEAQVADWILANPRQAVSASINEVANAVDVSEPTVIRFCRSLGASGFREFKAWLITALSRPDSYVHQAVNPEDAPADAATKVLDTAIKALVDVRDMASVMPFGAAAELLAGARQLIFVGIGASGQVARDACHKFFRLGIPSSTALDAQTILQSAAIAKEGDAYIAISHTGTWHETNWAMKLAKRRGARVIALTDPRTPLAAVADLVFECHPPENTNLYTPMSSRLAQLALLDALQIALALDLGEPAAKNLKDSKDALAWQRQCAHNFSLENLQQ